MDQLLSGSLAVINIEKCWDRKYYLVCEQEIYLQRFSTIFGPCSSYSFLEIHIW